MEALTAVQVGLLTIYDMCKAADRGMVMTNVRVLEKHGGKSGDWTAAMYAPDSFGFRGSNSPQLVTIQLLSKSYCKSILQVATSIPPSQTTVAT